MVNKSNHSLEHHYVHVGLWGWGMSINGRKTDLRSQRVKMPRVVAVTIQTPAASVTNDCTSNQVIAAGRGDCEGWGQMYTHMRTRVCACVACVCVCVDMGCRFC